MRNDPVSEWQNALPNGVNAKVSSTSSDGSTLKSILIGKTDQITVLSGSTTTKIEFNGLGTGEKSVFTIARYTNDPDQGVNDRIFTASVHSEKLGLYMHCARPRQSAFTSKFICR